MKVKLITSILIAFCSIICFAQKSTELKKIMTDHLKIKGKKPVHSIHVLISKGDTLFSEAVGHADGAKELADKDNQYKIASITKTMTSVVILQMQEEGKLKITDSIGLYLNDVTYARVNELHYSNNIAYGNAITIKQLLQHRSGLADLFTDAAFRFYFNMYFHKQQKWSPEKLMNRYYKYGLNKKTHFVPDAGYYYSDVNYFLLGLIIEKISGEPLAKQFRTRIFEPLGMQNTYFEYYEPARGNGKMAHSFFGKRDITKILNTSYDWAGGGVVSTNADLANFLKGIFEGELFKNDTSLQAMITMVPHTLKSGRVSNYGLGIYQYTFNGNVYYGHGGFWGSLIGYCPAEKTTFCGSINQVQPSFNTNNFIATLLKNFNDSEDR